MNTENIIINKGYSDPAKWHSEDTVWVLGLFGTAIGAGCCFCRLMPELAASGRC